MKGELNITPGGEVHQLEDVFYFDYNNNNNKQLF